MKTIWDCLQYQPQWLFLKTHNSHYGTLGTLVKSDAISLPCLPFPTTGQQLKELFPITRNTYWEGDRSLALL